MTSVDTIAHPVSNTLTLAMLCHLWVGVSEPCQSARSGHGRKALDGREERRRKSAHKLSDITIKSEEVFLLFNRGLAIIEKSFEIVGLGFQFDRAHLGRIAGIPSRGGECGIFRGKYPLIALLPRLNIAVFVYIS